MTIEAGVIVGYLILLGITYGMYVYQTILLKRIEKNTRKI